MPARLPYVRSARGRPWRREVAVLAGFAIVSIGYFGTSLLSHPGRAILGTGPDNEIFVWAFAWWPHAILTWTNPFVTHALFAPSGANLVWTTSVPGLALAFAPLTLAFGPVVSFNVAALLLPAVAAWAAYRLCFVLTGSLWASLVGGYLFGFSSFVLAQQILARVFLTADFTLPLIALAVVRFVRGEWSRAKLAVRLGVLIALQLSISTEVALTLTVMLLLTLALALLLARDSRPAVRSLLPPLAAGYGLGAVFAAPLVAYAILGFPNGGFIRDPTGTDLLNLFVPTWTNALLGSSFPSIQAYFNPVESAIFLGAPALLIAAMFAWRARRSGWSRVLVGGLVSALLLALGPTLLVAGRAVVSLPWALVQSLPGFEDVRTTRFGEYASLASAVIVALWAAQTRGRVFRRPYVLPVLAVVALAPAVWRPAAVLHPEVPAFFTTGVYERCIPADETIAFFGADANLVQVDTGFRFRIAGGYLTPPVVGRKSVIPFDNDPTIQALAFWGNRGRPSADSLLAFAVRHRVDRFVFPVGGGYPDRRQLAALGPVQRIGGVYVDPACGTPPLTARAPAPAVRTMLAEQKDGVTMEYCDHGDGYDLPVGIRPVGLLRGATRADFVAGEGLTCSVPGGYVPDGYASTALGVPGGTYPYYIR